MFGGLNSAFSAISFIVVELKPLSINNSLAASYIWRRLISFSFRSLYPHSYEYYLFFVQNVLNKYNIVKKNIK